MSDDSGSIVPTTRKQTLGDRIRTVANQLRQEDDVQIKATSRILGAAAQLAQNHDRLIDEVVEMVEEDLDRVVELSVSKPYTVEQLQQQFESFSEAKAHFDVKARSWDSLVNKLNDSIQSSSPSRAPTAESASSVSTQVSTHKKSEARKPTVQVSVPQRLEGIEQELQLMRADMNRIAQLLELLVAKQP